MLSIYLNENGISGPTFYGVPKWILWEELEECSFETVLGIPHLVFVAKDDTAIRITLLIDDFQLFRKYVAELSAVENFAFSTLFLTVVDDVI